VLLDAPCSGLGTLARNPDIRWRLSAPDIERHAHRQDRLLESVASLVRPGGRIVYSVCSLEPEEADEVVERFLGAHKDYTLGLLPSWTAPFADGPIIRVRPESHGSDGFFAAPLARASL